MKLDTASVFLSAKGDTVPFCTEPVYSVETEARDGLITIKTRCGSFSYDLTLTPARARHLVRELTNADAALSAGA